MSSTHTLGKGLALKRGDGASPETFTTIGQVVQLGDVGADKPLKEVTHFQSTAMEYINGLADGKQFNITCNALPEDATQSAAAGLMYDHNNDVVRDFRLYLPTASSSSGTAHYRFAATVLGWSMPATPGDVLRITFSLKISGAVTFYAT